MSRRITFRNLLFKIAGFAVFLSLGLSLASLAISSSNEDFGEFMFFYSPTLPLLPMVLAFHQLHKSRFRYWSHAVRAIGIIGAATLLMIPILGTLYPVKFPVYASGFLLCLVGFIGVWLLFNGLLGLQARAMPRELAMLSIVVGVTWLLGIVWRMLDLFNSLLLEFLNGFLAVNVFALVIGYLLWTIWAGCWFLTSRINNSSV